MDTKDSKEVVYVAKEKFAKASVWDISLQLIHMRYNHMSEPYCKKKAPLAKGNICFCDACAVGKLPNKKYNKQNYLQKKKRKKSYVSNEAGTAKPLPEPPPGDAKILSYLLT